MKYNSQESKTKQMKRVTIKEAFGGEVAFTKHIAKTKSVADRLLICIDENLDTDYSIVPEDKTVDSKRVDLVVKNSDGETHSVIESQDATGWLDTVHASKIAYYAYEKGTEDAVLIAEDADENVKGFIRWFNENTPLNIWLIQPIIFEVSTKKYHVEFTNIMRPFSIKQKRITKRNTGSVNSGYDYLDFYEKKNDELDGWFTHITKGYASKSNGAKPVKYYQIRKRNSYYLVWIKFEKSVDVDKIKSEISTHFSELVHNTNRPHDITVFEHRSDNWDTAVSLLQRVNDHFDKKK